MKFRPCIDIHEGVVKQIVGSSLTEDATQSVVENFISSKPASEFALKYKEDGLFGGHVIMLGHGCEEAALSSLAAFPGGLQIGGGITAENALHYLEAGASHVVVTSYVFRDGHIDLERLQNLVNLVGKERLVIDLSCRRKPADPLGPFYVVTNKWTLYTDHAVNEESLTSLAQYCDEFLVHGVDVEGKRCGIEEELVAMLGSCSPIPVTYAGGVRSLDDLELVKRLGAGKVDCTVGSALDMFGGDLSYASVVDWSRRQSN
jgi:phosphoribosylformimino-5-aminoimidazole carboxamide ribotide isomerase